MHCDVRPTSSVSDITYKPVHWTMEEDEWYRSTQHLCQCFIIRIVKARHPTIRDEYHCLKDIIGRFANNQIAQVANGDEITMTTKFSKEDELVPLTLTLYRKCRSNWRYIFVFKNKNQIYLVPSKQHTYCRKMPLPVVTYNALEGTFIEPGVKRNKNSNFIKKNPPPVPDRRKRHNILRPRDGTLQDRQIISIRHSSFRFSVFNRKTKENREVNTIDELCNLLELSIRPYGREEASLPLISRTTEDLPYPVQASEDLQGAVGPSGRESVYRTEEHNSVPETDEQGLQPSEPSRHEDYRNLQRRIASFTHWPHPATMLNCNQMADQGLFFAGPHDLVRCYHCGIGLKDWSHQDNPLYEHIRYAPYCEHLVHTIEPELLGHYRSFLLPSLTEAGSGQIRSQTDPSGNNYRHPEYQIYEVRVSSFAKWPRDIIQTPSQLAEAGFFYTGMQDVVRCFACDGGLQRWDTEDDPWIEHARWFPECAHVIQVKGMEYIQLVRLAMDPDSEDEDEDGGIAQGVSNMQINNGNGNQQPRKESDDPIYRPAAQSVIGFGYSRAAVKMAIEECNTKNIRWKAEDLLNLLLDKEDQGEVLPTDSPRPASPVMPLQIDTSTEEGLLVERSMLLERLKCISCEVNDVNALFLPCAHHRMCMDCVTDVTMCPICGKTIKEKVKTTSSTRNILPSVPLKAALKNRKNTVKEFINDIEWAQGDQTLSHDCTQCINVPEKPRCDDVTYPDILTELCCTYKDDEKSEDKILSVCTYKDGEKSEDEILSDCTYKDDKNSEEKILSVCTYKDDEKSEDEILSDCTYKDDEKSEDEIVNHCNSKDDGKSEDEVMNDCNSKDDEKSENEIVNYCNSKDDGKSEDEVMNDCNSKDDEKSENEIVNYCTYKDDEKSDDEIMSHCNSKDDGKSEDEVMNDCNSKDDEKSENEIVNYCNSKDDGKSEDEVMNDCNSKDDEKSENEIVNYCTYKDDEKSKDEIMNDCTYKDDEKSDDEIMNDCTYKDDEKSDDEIMNDCTYKDDEKSSEDEILNDCTYKDDKKSEDEILNDCNSKDDEKSDDEIMNDCTFKDDEKSEDEMTDDDSNYDSDYKPDHDTDRVEDSDSESGASDVCPALNRSRVDVNPETIKSTRAFNSFK